MRVDTELPPRASRVRLSEPVRELLHTPRQRGLKSFFQRAATSRALREFKSLKPIGRVKRARLAGSIPEVVRDTICRDRRQRRQVMFAKRLTAKGARASTRRSTSRRKC